MSLNGGNIHAGGIFFQSEDKKNGAGIRAINRHQREITSN